MATQQDGALYTSADSGASWVPRPLAGIRTWWSVASSGDGSRLVAAVSGGRLYRSADFGATWTASESVRYWYSVASSADGMNLVAVEYAQPLPGLVCTFQEWTPGPSHGIHGFSDSAVELLYIGSDTFRIVSQQGRLFLH